MSAQTDAPQQQIFEGKIFALLSYLSILCIIPLVLKRDNLFALYHGKQGLVLFIAEVAAFVMSIILPLMLIKLLFFVFGILSLWGIMASLQGSYIKMPFISDIAKKIIL